MSVFPEGFPSQTKNVTATASETVVLDFGFAAVAAPPSNNPPELDSIDDQTLDEGTTLAVAVSATDPDGDDITLSVLGLPPFPSLTDNDNGTGAITIVPGFGDAGTYPNVEVTATDNGGLSDAASFTIVVEGVNRPPVADANGPYVANEGETFTFDGSGSFVPHNDDLTYQWDLNGDSFFVDIIGRDP